jgi:hypothetical protein
MTRPNEIGTPSGQPPGPEKKRPGGGKTTRAKVAAGRRRSLRDNTRQLRSRSTYGIDPWEER